MQEMTRAGVGSRRSAAFVLLVTLCALARPADAAAQYFGRNKVQYERFDFQVLATEHFDLHYYPSALLPSRDAARMAERWYARLGGVLGHEILSRQPVVLYADHADFQQTNVIEGMIDESTGGVTEGMQRRVVLPLTGAYGDTDHVLGHELVHAFQYDIAARSGGIARMDALPLWAIEGMAEYLSVGRYDPHTAMWLRDAVLHDDVPTLGKLTRDGRYFPYRFGQAVWAYIGGRWGDARVGELYTAALRTGWERALRDVLDMREDSLSKEWIAAVRGAYEPLIAGRTAPDSVGRRVAGRRMAGEMLLGPSISPDGRWVAYLWARDFALDLYVADVHTGEVVRQLASGGAESHIDAVSFMGSSGTWSPDGRKFAYVAFARGDQELVIVDVASGDSERRIHVDGVSAIASPAWSPDGASIALSGSAGGLSDLYVLDLASSRLRRLTNDRYADLQPAWSPDGHTIAFVTDRDNADMDRLVPGTMRIALIDVASGSVRALPLFAAGRNLNPQFSSDGSDLFFLAEPDGFRDLYRTRLDSGELFRVTRIATGITGLTSLSPALSVARESGDIVFSVFDRRGYFLSAIDGGAAAGQPVAITGLADAGAGVLPPRDARERVERYLADAATGLPDTAYFATRSYSPKPKLGYFGLPTVGLGMDRFGVGLYTDVQAYFTDVLGDHGVFVQGISNGSFRDIGGQVFYENRAGRLNWGAGIGHIPYVDRYALAQQTQNGTELLEYRRRLVEDQAFAAVRYPLSTTRRIELSGGLTRIGYELQLRRELQAGNRTIERETIDLIEPLHYTLWQGGAAFVGDNSVFGIASPVDGARFRFEIQPTLGSFDYVTALADWRRYEYRRPFTFAVRALHYGRYGGDAGRQELGSLFVGSQDLVRGYDYYSYEPADCTVPSAGITGCAALDNLFGTRLAVGNIEVRLPLIGNERVGLINFAFLPTELAAFVDGGIAWTGDEGVSFNGGGVRTPVFSAGVSARFNLFGALVAETYYAIPFQRATGGRFGFQLTPGW